MYCDGEEYAKRYAYMCVGWGALSYLTLCNPMDLQSHQTPLSIFLRQEYWSRLPSLTLGDLPNPAWTDVSVSPALEGGFLTTVPPGKPEII